MEIIFEKSSLFCFFSLVFCLQEGEREEEQDLGSKETETFCNFFVLIEFQLKSVLRRLKRK